MKLYRGLKSSEFKDFSDDIQSSLKKTWTAILKQRSQSDWSFPANLNNEIVRAEKLLRLQRQHFTDRRDIALNYATTNKGSLVEIDIPQSHILKHFRLEFQNFAKRKSNFEVVYVVESSLLQKNRKKWKMKILNLGDQI